MSREQQTLLFFQPVIGLVVLTLGAVAVLAGVIAVALLLTLRAEIELAPRVAVRQVSMSCMARRCEGSIRLPNFSR